MKNALTGESAVQTETTTVFAGDGMLRSVSGGSAAPSGTGGGGGAVVSGLETESSTLGKLRNIFGKKTGGGGGGGSSGRSIGGDVSIPGTPSSKNARNALPGPDVHQHRSVGNRK